MRRRTPPGFPPFTPLRTRPTPTSPNLGTDLTTASSALTLTGLKSMMDKARFSVESEADRSSSETRWNSLSPDANDATARRGGVNFPAAGDLKIGKPFELDWAEDKNPFSPTERMSMAEYMDDLVHSQRAKKNATGSNGTASSSSAEELLAAGLTLDDLLGQQPPPPQHQRPSPFEFTVAGQAIEGLETEQMRGLFRSLEGDGLGDVFAGHGGSASGFAGTGGGGADGDQAEQEAFEQ